MRGVHDTGFSMVPSWQLAQSDGGRPERLACLRRAQVAGLAAHEERGVLLMREGINHHGRRDEGSGHQEDSRDARASAYHRSYPIALGMRFTASGRDRRSAPPALKA